MVIYIPAPKVIMADTLSRLPNHNKSEDALIDDHVHGISISESTIIDGDLLNFSPTKQSEIRQCTSTDHVLKTLSETIYTGWPDNIQQLPSDVREYWSCHDEVTFQNGIILKGHQVVIPLLLVVSLHQSDPLSDTFFCDIVVNHEMIKRTCLSQQRALEEILHCLIIFFTRGVILICIFSLSYVVFAAFHFRGGLCSGISIQSVCLMRHLLDTHLGFVVACEVQIAGAETTAPIYEWMVSGSVRLWHV